MDVQTLLNVVGGLLIGLFGWVCREIWDALQKLRVDLHRIEVALPQNYVQKSEFHDGLREIKDMLRLIADKLDGKVDK